jgi:hypothetical protein
MCKYKCHIQGACDMTLYYSLKRKYLIECERRVYEITFITLIVKRLEGQIIPRKLREFEEKYKETSLENIRLGQEL